MRTDYQSVVFTVNARDFPLVCAGDWLFELRQQSESTTTEDSFVLLRAVRIAKSGVFLFRATESIKGENCSFVRLITEEREHEEHKDSVRNCRRIVLLPLG